MLRHLLSFWLFQFLMLFAAATTIGDVGTGGGDGGAGGGSSNDGGAGDDAGSTGDDSGADDGAGAGDDGSSGDDGADDAGAAGDGGADTDPNATVDLGDGRQVPGKIKKLFDLAKKAGVEKEAKQLFFANQRLNKAIPGGVNAAIQLAKDVEELGGLEGVQSLQDSLQGYQANDENFSSNPAKWVESGFSENPEAALKAFAHTLDYVGDNHPEHYNHLMAKVIVNDLGSLDVRGIHQILAGIKDNPQAAALAKQLADYFNSRLKTSQKVPEKKNDPNAKALNDRETAVTKKEMDLRYKEVNAEVFPVLKTEVTKVLQAEAKAAKLDLTKLSKDYPAEWRNMLNEIHQGIMKAAIKDQRFIDKYSGLVQKGDMKRAAAAINKKHAELAPDISRQVMSSYGVFRAKRTAAAAVDKNNRGGDGGGNSNAGNAGWQSVSKRPENSSIDWGKTTQALQLDGKYFLKDGKKVVVKY